MTNRHEQLLRELLEALEEPDYCDRTSDGAVLAVWDYRRIRVELIQQARESVGLPRVTEDCR